MKRCQACGVFRARLYECAVCEARLCGCCSFRPSGHPPKIRYCCYPKQPLDCGTKFKGQQLAKPVKTFDNLQAETN